MKVVSAYVRAAGTGEVFLRAQGLGCSRLLQRGVLMRLEGSVGVTWMEVVG